MQPNKLQIATEVSGVMMDHLGETKTDEYVIHNMTQQLAHELAKTCPKAVTRIPRPTVLSVDPPYYLTPAALPQIDYRYEMTLYVFTDDDLDNFIDDIRHQIQMELAMDRALYLPPEYMNMA